MTRIIVFNGKGGVGKTTVSCSAAIWFASRGFKTIILSTDPAASVGDCLNQAIGKEPVEVQGVPNLWALEIDGTYEYQKLRTFITTHNKNNMEQYFAEHGMPGMNEMAALFRVVTYLYNLKYDVIIVDTAPTGHTLEMLALPKTLQETMNGLKVLMNNINMWKQLISGNTRDKTSKRIDTIMGCVNKISEVLSNSEITHFNLVSIPEFMALREEARAYNTLCEYGIQVRNIVLNRVQPENHECMYCMERFKQHEHYFDIMTKQFEGKNVDIIKLKQFPREVVGIDTLKNIGTAIMQQMENITIEKSYRVMAQNGGFYVYTQLPFIPPENLSFKTEKNILEMHIFFGLHEDIVNAMAFPRAISSVKPINQNNKLVLYVS